MINGDKRDYGPVTIDDTIEIGDFTLVLQKQAKKEKSKQQKVSISEDGADHVAKTVFSPVAAQVQKIDCSMLGSDGLFILYRISHLANSSSDLQESLQSIVDELYKTFKPDRVLVATLENNGEKLHCSAKAPGEDVEVKLSRTMLKYLLENKRILITEDALVDEKF